MKKTLFLLLIASLTYNTSAQNKAAEGNSVIKWYTIEEAEKLFNKSPRPIFIDTYTDWCGWCKKMDSDNIYKSCYCRSP